MTIMRYRHLLAILFALMAATAAAPYAVGEIVFVDLDDLPLDPATERFVVTDGPFIAEFLHIPCAELPPGIAGPPCIVANCGLFGGLGDTPDMLGPGDLIDGDRRFQDEAFLVDYNVTGDVTTGFNFELIDSDWVNPTGGRVHGFLGYGGSADEPASDPHYGWIELTVEYDPASNSAGITLHGYAYEDRENIGIRAGELPALGADFDGDGDVDGDDFLKWQASFGLDAGGDADGDGDSDGDDFLIWQTEFGGGDGSASAAVPEPASIVLLFVTLVCAVFVRRRQVGVTTRMIVPFLSHGGC